ncbi:spore coat associated protein CotJA [Filobacillus milosensis]|uniref:Spore coat associated protein CotJA n=1 Tax=Filobacillus milosensis TaxID=94137 RepID=A0A4Y8INT0_9BACI|nr:spore coat associated protein CotJA [Filobacillus milosensis]TFB23139.1 spore coat associated protein CotJA [Filobacillus milosensis]
MENSPNTYTWMKTYQTYHSVYDPCPPLGTRYYSTPPNLYLGFQPPNLEQFQPNKALKKGTLWPILYDYYENPYEKKRR